MQRLEDEECPEDVMVRVVMVQSHVDEQYHENVMVQHQLVDVNGRGQVDGLVSNQNEPGRDEEMAAP